VKIKLVGNLLEPDRTLTSCVSDCITGEVYECFRSPQRIGDCIFMGFMVPDRPSKATELPTGKDGRSKLFCRILAPADMRRVESILSQIPKISRKPLKLGHWYKVLYD
jgi:hypothetical protein